MEYQYFSRLGVSEKFDLSLSLRRRRKHEAWGASPRVPSLTDLQPVITGDSLLVSWFFRPLTRAQIQNQPAWGLRPRLYAYACFAG